MDLNLPKLEKKILKYWRENKTFEKSILERKKAPSFVFYEGPPTANAKPGIHHVLARVFKDIICRYKTMQGFKVLRKAGWDTHGLPVELEVEKKLGFKNKKDIEKYGIASFNKKCKTSVWRYKGDWEKLTERVGHWLDMGNPYITYESDYIESVWWIIKQIWQKGLLYQDYKVVPYCPRCETSLSSHEVAQGYKKIKETSVYLKFKIKKAKAKYFLVWTTTPWTLPANVALAVNPNLNYIEVKLGSKETYILVEDRLEYIKKLFNIKSVDVTKKIKGKDLIGLEYEQLIKFAKPDKPSFRVVAGDFVSTDEGTGIVHIAPAFGEDDMEVAKKNNLPLLMTIDERGRFKPEIKPWAGVFVKEADRLIAEYLEKDNLLFGKELYEHDYPFCWRCLTPLLYYAKQSWFIRMKKVKKDLINNNEKINWIPPHLKKGRFGEWLNDLKDWAFSRERYWGTPLPVWRCKKCHNLEVIGSKEDLAGQKFSTNQFFILRHGESIKNKKKIVSCWPEKFKSPLTKKGEKQIEKVAEKLKGKIDYIISSDLLRTKQTAEIIGKALGIKIKTDKRIREVNEGIFNGKPIISIGKFFDPEKKLGREEYYLMRFRKNVPGGENYTQVFKRVHGFLKDINKKYSGKRILIISHELPLTLLETILIGLNKKEIIKFRDSNKKIQTGEQRKVSFKSWPYNEEAELDFHRPYIDEVKFQCQKCQHLMERVPDLIDVWFDSGSMPFSQYHYPFENKKLQKDQFPADYISEAIDQTRGWFFTLLAISTLLKKGRAFKNVISLGHILDEKGEKMSKSKGNVVDPWQIIDKYGADTIRWNFYTLNQPGDVKFFSEKDFNQALKKFIMTLWNSFVFYDTYVAKKREEKYYRTFGKSLKGLSSLDAWIISKLHGLIEEVNESLDNFNITSGARAIENFTIEDFSNWYIRRSRKRLQKSNNKKDFEIASKTLGYVLFKLITISAPFIPFTTEAIYKNLIISKRSLHLTDWPKVNKGLINKNLNKKMDQVRQIVSLGLKARMKEGIKVRQPLGKLEVKSKELQYDKELLILIREELNVKEIAFNAKIKEEIKLDAKITQELKEEGQIREFIRYIQQMRKKADLKPRHKILVQYSSDPSLNNVLLKNKEFILKETRAKSLKEGKRPKQTFNIEKEVKIDQQNLWLGIKKL
ncbi:MAG: isoleucine--tRNA ligase [Parcubacteria group bacterium]|nr:isoleucine--tRNA ligase [Parcubacteria group bacterium]|tara:strand:- start:9551 stop:13039 length:3489 start_codon:yes stop_codon:yes gene_type:complete